MVVETKLEYQGFDTEDFLIYTSQLKTVKKNVLL